MTTKITSTKLKNALRRIILRGCMAILTISLLTTGKLTAQTETNFGTTGGVPIFPLRTTAPSSPATGMMYYNTADKTIYWYDGTQWITIGTPLSPIPSASKPLIAGNFYVGGEVYGNYTFTKPATGSPEKNSPFQWLWSTSSEATSGTLMTKGTVNYGTTTESTAGTDTKTTLGSDVSGKFIALKVTPLTTAGSEGNSVLSAWALVASGKIVASVTTNSSPTYIYNNLSLGTSSTHTVAYTYTGTNNTDCPQTNAAYRWLRSDNADGSGTLTELGTTSTYTVQPEDTTKYIALEITPYSDCGAVVEKGTSGWKQAKHLIPKLAAVTLGGTSTVSSTVYALNNTLITLSGTYTCSPVSLAAGTHLYQWYWTNDGGSTKIAVAAGTDKSYTVNTSDGKHPSSGTIKLACLVTPVASNGDQGEPVLSNWATVPTENGTYASITYSAAKAPCGTAITATVGALTTTPVSGVGVASTAYEWCRKAVADPSTIIGLGATASLTSYTPVKGSPWAAGDLIALRVTATLVDGSVCTTQYGEWLTVSTWSCGDDITVSHVAGDGVAPITTSITYGTKKSTAAGALGYAACWIDRNIGQTTASTAASSSTYIGWYFQFNRAQGTCISLTGSISGINSFVSTAISESTGGWLAAKDPCYLSFGSGWSVMPLAAATAITSKGGTAASTVTGIIGYIAGSGYTRYSSSTTVASIQGTPNTWLHTTYENSATTTTNIDGSTGLYNNEKAIFFNVKCVNTSL